jgi:hypothetical protein
MNEQDVQNFLLALLTEDSVQLGERGADDEPTFEEAGVVISCLVGAASVAKAGSVRDQCRIRLK